MKKTDKAVVLLHGFMNNSLVMTYLGSKISAEGYKVYHFNYRTRHYSEKTLEDLDNLISKVSENEIYLVGHSMGGLVIRNYVHQKKFKDKMSKIKGVVTVATPHNQSLTAHKINKTLKGFLGTAGDAGLTKDIGKWTSAIPIGCIAGLYKAKWNANLFLIFHKMKKPNDGTVFLEEAIVENCHDSVIIEGSHTGLLFQKNVAKQIINYLENAKFDKCA